MWNLKGAEALFFLFEKIFRLTAEPEGVEIHGATRRWTPVLETDFFCNFAYKGLTETEKSAWRGNGKTLIREPV